MESMQENEGEKTRNTNSVDSSFTSIAWVLEAIDRTLVYWVFWLRVGKEDKMKFIREKKEEQKKGESLRYSRRGQQGDIKDKGKNDVLFSWYLAKRNNFGHPNRLKQEKFILILLQIVWGKKSYLPSCTVHANCCFQLYNFWNVGRSSSTSRPKNVCAVHRLTSGWCNSTALKLIQQQPLCCTDQEKKRRAEALP